MWRGRKRTDEDFSEEIRANIALDEDRFIADGMTPEQARAAALRAFGNVTRTQERFYESRRVMWLHDLGRDLEYAIRTLVRNPGFAAVTVLTLALGIGANTAIFSVINALLLHPAGVAQPDRVVAIRMNITKSNLRNTVISPRDFTEVRDSREIFASAAIAQGPLPFSYAASARPEPLMGERVSWQWFEVLGARPMVGRSFGPEDDQPNANQVVILAYRTWHRLFGGDPSILGKTIQLDERPYKVIGIVGPEYDRSISAMGSGWSPFPQDLYVPLGLPPQDYAPANRFNQSYLGLARLQPGVTFERAQAFMGILTTRAFQDPGGEQARITGWNLFIIPYTEFVAGNLKTPIFVLMGAVGFVLLIACANIAGLTMARASGRKREFALRAALGASRWRLVRQTFAESALLTIAGLLLGLIVAFGGVRALGALAPQDLAAGLNVRVDAMVMAFAAIVGMLSGVLFGIAPAWQLRSDTFGSLKEGGRSGTSGRAPLRFRSMLAMAEVALALVLLVGAGLFLRSLWRLQSVDTGFESSGVMTGILALPKTRYESPEEKVSFYRATLERLSTIPGVTTAAVAWPLPLSGASSSESFSIEGRDYDRESLPHANIQSVSPSYFSVLRIPIKTGRSFSEHDTSGSELVVVIDENVAQQYWPNENPIGKRINRFDDRWRTIVGVVGHVKHSELAADSGKGACYFPLDQVPSEFAALLVKTAVEPGSLASAMEGAVRAVDPTQSMGDLQTMQGRVLGTLGSRRFASLLLAFFAGTALFLAALGLYWVISYGVIQRTREIGTRMALGAQSRDVLVMVIRETLLVGIAGLAFGTAGAFLLTRTVSSLLYGVASTDATSFLFAALCLLVVTVVAGYLPARKAAGVDPIVALRCD